MPVVLNVNTTVRGYDVYRTVWDPSPGECFVVLHQPGNNHDCHAMAVYGLDEPGQIVGHIPWEILWISHYCTLQYNVAYLPKVFLEKLFRYCHFGDE